MKVFNNIELIDLAIYTNKTLIVTDFHIGYEEALNKQGLMVPRFQFDEIMARLDSIFKKLRNKKIERIIINGDLKHEFGTISNQEWRHTLKLLDFFEKHCKEIILIKGNHDTFLGPIAKKRNVKVLEHYLISTIKEKTMKKDSIINKNEIKEINNKSQLKNIKSIKKFNIKNRIEKKFKKIINKKNQNNKTLKNSVNCERVRSRTSSLASHGIFGVLKNSKNFSSILVMHGDEIPNKGLLKGVSTIIIGHEHPAVSVREGPRAELFKAFLVGKWKGKNIIAQPSFNLVTEGTDVLKEEILSPFLKGNLRNLNAVIVADKLYGFGKIRDLS